MIRRHQDGKHQAVDTAPHRAQPAPAAATKAKSPVGELVVQGEFFIPEPKPNKGSKVEGQVNVNIKGHRADAEGASKGQNRHGN
jgi:hypothetical protein